jgi:hypothetical protein
MPDKIPKSGRTDSFDLNRSKQQRSDPSSNLLGLLGGEELDGSGFETEIPEPESEWRDPQ